MDNRLNERTPAYAYAHTPHGSRTNHGAKTKSRCLSFGARPLPSRTPDVSCLIAAAPVYRATKNAPGCPEAPVSQSAARTGDKSNGPRGEAGPVPRRRLRFSSISLFLTRAAQWRRPVNDSYGVCHRKPRGQPHFLRSPEREPIAFRFFWIQHRGDDLAASPFNRHPSSGRARGNQKAGQSASF